ncbi:uncharacterized protein LOC117123020 [Anneissia japonica]|uniref:uncharacterized protein LOC117123020 n=1 Tax=Anneissia japonica TaxID=1529436 RepID=UPI00142583CD|nr:uncharacterized protein LOC117123020 [Anneissia japonica]
MGRCLSKNKVEPITEDNQIYFIKKQLKEHKKINRFLRLAFWRKSNKVGILPEGEDTPSDPPLGCKTSSVDSLSDHASLMSHDDRVNEELVRLKDENSTANIVPSVNLPARRLPPIGMNRSLPTIQQDMSSCQILEKLRESGVITNTKPGRSGCSFDIIDRATPVLDMPRSLSRLQEREEDTDNAEGIARIERKLTAAERRRNEFLGRRKQQLAVRRSEIMQKKVADQREARRNRLKAKMSDAEARRQNQLLLKANQAKFNSRDVKEKLSKIENEKKTSAFNTLQQKQNAADKVLQKKEDERALAQLANQKRHQAVQWKIKEEILREKVDMDYEMDPDVSFFAYEEKYDL